jgi:hypothetical protein
VRTGFLTCQIMKKANVTVNWKIDVAACIVALTGLVLALHKIGLL